MSDFDVVVIGAGPGGYVAAIRAAQLGQKTALIEKGTTLGGTCLNIGCIPSKALLESSELVSIARHRFAEHGIVTGGDITVDLGQMMTRKRSIVKSLCDGIRLLMKKNDIKVFHGKGELISPTEIFIHSSAGKTDKVSAKNIILATGSEPIELPFLPFDGTRIVSSTEALSFDTVPQSLAVVGGGAIGLELGSVWARLGSSVSVVELLPRIVPFADAEMAKLLQRSLTKQGLVFHLGCKVTGAKKLNQHVELNYTDKNGRAEKIVADRVLVAVGRKAYSTGLGLANANVATEQGKVIVDGQYRTNTHGIYAIGDLVAGPMLAHKAEDEGVAVAETIAGKTGHVNYSAIPNIVYTWPELAEVGINEEQAKEQNIDYRVGKYKFAANGRAKTLGESEGQAKIIADAKTDRILGAHIVGPRASDMIAELVVAMEFASSAEDIARTCHAHPTLAEIVKEAALAVDSRMIHG